MSAASNFGFLTNDDLPSRDEVATLCRQAGYRLSGIPLRKEPGGPVLAWVKYGGNVAIAEALTQDWVAKALDANPEAVVCVPRVYDAFTIPTRWCNIGHIVMQHIDAPDCEESDVELVAKAVEWLIRLKAPSSAPGPVGGGPVFHTFFCDWESLVTYNTVEELEDHVNGILALKEDPRRVSFVAEARDGLYLCPCDIHPGNFKKGRDGKVVALDFRATCFLPRSFFAFAMARPVNNFGFKVARHLTYPPSGNVSAMISASYYLVPYGKSTIGLPESILARMRR